MLRTRHLVACRVRALREALTVQPIRALCITLTGVLAWLAVASVFVVASAAGAESATAALPAAGPQQVMADLSAQLFAALEKESASSRRKAEEILPLVDALLSPRFDREYAARLVLGLHWRNATPDQRQLFAVALYRRLLHTYVGAVSEWSADRVKLLPLRNDSSALQVIVRSQVTDSAGANVPVDYRLRQTTEGWKIFDVIVEGVSYVRSYHDDTDQEVTQNGLDATITRLAGRDTSAAVQAPARAPGRTLNVQ